MAANTRYHHLSEEQRTSMESSNTKLDAGLLLLDPMRGDDGNTPPKKEHRFSCHPTLLFRLIAICVFIPSFVLFIVARRPRNVSAIIFVCFSLVRNILVIFHYILSKQLRIKFSIELRNKRPIHAKPSRSCPEWLKQGIVPALLDVILVIVTLITTIIANQGAYNWHRRWYAHDHLVVPACVLSYIGVVFYLISCFDLGKPSNITTSGGIAFDYGNRKKDERPDQPPQVYRDVEAAGGLAGVETRKSGADSPVII